MSSNNTTYYSRKASGLCPKCGKPVDRDGRVYHKECQDDKKGYKQFFASIGICPICKKNAIYGNEKSCFECKARVTNWAAEKRKDDKIRMRHNEVARACHARKAKIAAEQGLCHRCFKPLKPGEGYYCRICQNKKNVYQNERRQRITGKPARSLWTELGLCYGCGKPNDNEPKKVCKSCMEKRYKVWHEKSGEDHPWRKAIITGGKKIERICD